MNITIIMNDIIIIIIIIIIFKSITNCPNMIGR